jgi:hypothetical protein
MMKNALLLPPPTGIDDTWSIHPKDPNKPKAGQEGHNWAAIRLIEEIDEGVRVTFAGKETHQPTLPMDISNDYAWRGARSPIEADGPLIVGGPWWWAVNSATKRRCAINQRHVRRIVDDAEPGIIVIEWVEGASIRVQAPWTLDQNMPPADSGWNVQYLLDGDVVTEA